MKRLLVLGCGSIGERHIRCFSRAGEVDVTPVDARPERLAAVQEQYGTRPGLTDLSETNLEAFDAVLICTPSNQHLSQALQAARAGCHLFIEKPLSTTLEGVDELIAYCRDQNLTLQVGYVYRHHPLMAEIEEALLFAGIGTVHMVNVKSGYPVDQARPDFRRTYWMHAATGGGVFYDASHQLDFIQNLISPITAVTALTRHYQFAVDADVEDAGLAIFEFASGAIGMATLNHFQRNRTSRLELVAAQGTILWEMEKNQLVIYRDSDHSWRRHRLEMQPDDTYLLQARNFLGALEGKNPPLVSGEDGRRALAVALAALESSKKGARVEVLPPSCS